MGKIDTACQKLFEGKSMWLVERMDGFKFYVYGGITTTHDDVKWAIAHRLVGFYTHMPGRKVEEYRKMIIEDLLA